jgi:hypothetical protein
MKPLPVICRPAAIEISIGTGQVCGVHIANMTLQLSTYPAIRVQPLETSETAASVFCVGTASCPSVKPLSKAALMIRVLEIPSVNAYLFDIPHYGPMARLGKTGFSCTLTKASLGDHTFSQASQRSIRYQTHGAAALHELQVPSTSAQRSFLLVDRQLQERISWVSRDWFTTSYYPAILFQSCTIYIALHIDRKQGQVRDTIDDTVASIMATLVAHEYASLQW